MFRTGLICIAWMTMPLFALAQSAPSNVATVTSQGQMELKKDAVAMRLVLEVRGKGKDLKSALALLSERKGLAEEYLLRQGAAKDTIRWDEAAIAAAALPETGPFHFEPPTLAPGPMSLQPTLPQPMPAKSPEVVVISLLRVDFSLSAGGAEDRLLKVHELQGKVRSMELAGSAKSDSSTPACNCGCKGEPMFLFIAKVSAEERAQTLSQAFAKAKDAAGRLAIATGAELGSVQSLMMNSQPTCTSCPLSQNQSESSADAVQEIQGVTLGSVAYRVSVSTSFVLQPRQK